MILGLISLDYLTYKEKEYEILDIIEKKSKNGDLRCPNCGCKVKFHGTYKRNVIFSDENTLTFKIFQIRCIGKNCRQVHALIPDFVFPRKHYCSAIINNINLNCSYETCPADNSTIRRWISEQAGRKPEESKQNNAN